MRTLLQVLTLSLAAILVIGNAAAETGRLMIGERERSYFMERPRSGTGPYPTVIMLHGFNSVPAGVAQATGLGEAGPRNGFVTVFPNGLGQGWNHWLPGKALPFYVEHSRKIGGAPNDIGFVNALVADLVRRGITDPKRVYLSGFSNGSFLTLRMICSNSGLFAAYALLVGVMPEMLGPECRPGGAPVLMVNGTADTVNPYIGGMVMAPNSFNVWPSERLASYFREQNGCTGEPEKTAMPSKGPLPVERWRWINCKGGRVVFLRVIGGKHAVPPETGDWMTAFFRDKVRP